MLSGTRFPNPHMKRVQTDPLLCEAPDKTRPITVASPRNNQGGVARKSSGVPQKHNAWDSRKSSLDGLELGVEDSTIQGLDPSSPVPTSPRSSKPTFSVGSGNLENWTNQGLPNISPSRNTSASGKKKSDYYFNRMGSAKRKASLTKDGRSEISTRMPLDAIGSELVRVVSNMNAAEIQLRGVSTYLCDFHRVKLQVTFCKDLPNLCQIHFELVSGNDYKLYQEICKEILRLLEV